MMIAITGAPNAGKTKTVKDLASLGHPTMHEVATKVILEGHLLPWKDPIPFRREVLRRQLIAESQLPKDEISFVDRGIFDGIAYCYATDCPVPDFLNELKGPRYDKAYLLEPLKTWESDGIRYEDLSFSERITPIMEDVYRQKGVEVVRVPLMPPADRLAFMLNDLRLPYTQYQFQRSGATELVTA